jgi:hypothetical protein
MARKNVRPVVSCAGRLTFSVIHYIRVKKQFFYNCDLLIKTRRILSKIQNYKLFLVKVAPEKVINETRCCKNDFGGFLGESI